MAALSGARAALALLVASAAQAAQAAQVDRWSPFVREASVRFGLPASWIRAVIRAESAGRAEIDGRVVTSRAGAMGLMQVMPATWSDMRRQYHLGSDPYDPHDNIMAGTAYLRAMYDRFGYPGMFAAYNAGPARYARYLDTGSPLPAETTAYLVKVGPAPEHSAAGAVVPDRPILDPLDSRGSAAKRPGLFVLRRQPPDTPAAATPGSDQQDHLFAVRAGHRDRLSSDRDGAAGSPDARVTVAASR